MKIYTNKRLNEIVKDVNSNFKEIIDYIIYYDSQNEDIKAWELIYKIEELPHKDEIKLILEDFNKRDLTNSSTLLYNSLLYGLVNNPDSKLELINILKHTDNINFKSYLSTLNKNKGRDGDLNIVDVLNAVEKIESKNKI